MDMIIMKNNIPKGKLSINELLVNESVEAGYQMSPFLQKVILNDVKRKRTAKVTQSRKKSKPKKRGRVRK